MIKKNSSPSICIAMRSRSRFPVPVEYTDIQAFCLEPLNNRETLPSNASLSLPNEQTSSARDVPRRFMYIRYTRYTYIIYTWHVWSVWVSVLFAYVGPPEWVGKPSMAEV